MFVSAVFFGGVPGRILNAWRDGDVTLVTSPEILDEYRKTGDRLTRRFPGVDLDPTIALIASAGVVVDAPPLSHPVCTDPDDDMFIACAIASAARFVVTGDRALLRVSEFRNVRVVTPRRFVDRYL